MFRLLTLAGPVAFLAVTGVSAGPCRPSSIITGSSETTATSTEIGESTTALPTSTTETDISETLSLIVSTTEIVTTTDASMTLETTTSLDTTTAFETTTALPTTTALATGPVDCPDLPNPFTAPDGTRFNIKCDTAVEFYIPLSSTIVGNFKECVLKCSGDSSCKGVNFRTPNSQCDTFASSPGNFGNNYYHSALKVTG